MSAAAVTPRAYTSLLTFGTGRGLYRSSGAMNAFVL